MGRGRGRGRGRGKGLYRGSLKFRCLRTAFGSTVGEGVSCTSSLSTGTGVGSILTLTSGLVAAP